MIHAVIEINDKSDHITGLIGLRAYFPQNMTMLVETHNFSRVGKVDVKEEFRSSFEHVVTANFMSAEINDIIRLQQIIPYCNNNEAISEAMDICKKLEKNLHIKAIYKDELKSSIVICDDPVSDIVPTHEHINDVYVSLPKTLKKHVKGM